jgi:hypothetical protein
MLIAVNPVIYICQRFSFERHTHLFRRNIDTQLLRSAIYKNLNLDHGKILKLRFSNHKQNGFKMVSKWYDIDSSIHHAFSINF